jgi:hypothetical protein
VWGQACGVGEKRAWWVGCVVGGTYHAGVGDRKRCWAAPGGRVSCVAGKVETTDGVCGEGARTCFWRGVCAMTRHQRASLRRACHRRVSRQQRVSGDVDPTQTPALAHRLVGRANLTTRARAGIRAVTASSHTAEMLKLRGCQHRPPTSTEWVRMSSQGWQSSCTSASPTLRARICPRATAARPAQGLWRSTSTALTLRSLPSRATRSLTASPGCFSSTAASRSSTLLTAAPSTSRMTSPRTRAP